MFSKIVDLASEIGDRIGGRQVETVVSGMSADGTVLYPGGQVTNEYVLGVCETKVYGGQAASAALAHSRYQSPAPEAQRLASLDRRRNLDDRLRALGVKV